MSTPSKIVFWTFVGFGLLCVFAIFTIFGPVFLVNSVNEIVFHIKERDNTIQVQAIVTDIQESTDSEGGTNTDVYISYEYDNISYNDIYWKMSGKYSINETVNVEIYKSKPSKIVDAGFSMYIEWIFPFVMTIVELISAKFLIGELIKTIKMRSSCGLT